ncbi:hypothetical protein VTI74DRAFT_685 [Chaetomium olivicolor]
MVTARCTSDLLVVSKQPGKQGPGGDRVEREQRLGTDRVALCVAAEGAAEKGVRVGRKGGLKGESATMYVQRQMGLDVGTASTGQMLQSNREAGPSIGQILEPQIPLLQMADRGEGNEGNERRQWRTWGSSLDRGCWLRYSYAIVLGRYDEGQSGPMDARGQFPVARPSCHFGDGEASSLPTPPLWAGLG